MVSLLTRADSEPRANPSGADRARRVPPEVIIATLAAIPRLVALRTPLLMFPDSATYLQVSNLIRHGTGPYNGMRLPGMAVLVLLCGSNFAVVKGLFAVLGVAAAVLVFRLVRRYAGSGWGWAAGILYAWTTAGIYTEHTLLTEAPAAHFLVLWMVVLDWVVTGAPRRAAGLRAPLALGVTTAFVASLRPSMACLAIVAAVAVALTARRRARADAADAADAVPPRRRGELVRHELAVLVPVVALLLGWSVFNSVVVDYAGPTTTGAFTLSNTLCDHVELVRDEFPDIVPIFVAARAEVERRSGACDGTIWVALPKLEAATRLTIGPLAKRVGAMDVAVIGKVPDAYATGAGHRWLGQWAPNYGAYGKGANLVIPMQPATRLGQVESYLDFGLQLVLLVGGLLWCVARMVCRPRRAPDLVVYVGAAVLLNSVVNVMSEADSLARHLLPILPAWQVTGVLLLASAWTHRPWAAGRTDGSAAIGTARPASAGDRPT